MEEASGILSRHELENIVREFIKRHSRNVRDVRFTHIRENRLAGNNIYTIFGVITVGRADIPTIQAEGLTFRVNITRDGHIVDSHGADVSRAI